MGILEKVEIRNREAALHRTGPQKFAEIAPFLFLSLFLFAPAFSLITREAALDNETIKDILFVYSFLLLGMAYIQFRALRRISYLELELIRFKQNSEERNEK
jgi:O-antigen ligase